MCRHSQAPPNFKFQDSHLETPSPRQSPWSTTPPASGPATCQIHTQSHASPAVAGPNLTRISSFTTQPLNVQILRQIGNQPSGSLSSARLPTTRLRARSAASPVSIAPHPLFEFSI